MIASVLAVQADGIEIAAALGVASAAVAAVWTFLTRRLDKTEAARDAERATVEASRAVERDKYLASVQSVATQHEAAMGRLQGNTPGRDQGTARRRADAAPPGPHGHRPVRARHRVARQDPTPRRGVVGSGVRVNDEGDRHVGSVEGIVEHLGPKAEVALFIEASTERYAFAREEFDRLKIGEGDDFWFDIFYRDGKTIGRIRAPEPTVFAGPNTFDSPDELSARAGRGP